MKNYYDDQGNKIKEEYSNGYWKKYEYDKKGNRIKFEDSSGDWRKYLYDEKGNMIKKENSYGNWEKYEYNERSNKIKYENSDGNWKKYEYDAQGNLIKEENSDGDWCKYEYDAQGNKIKEENSSGSWVKYEYDEKGNKIKLEYSSGEGDWKKYEYDAQGNTIKAENSNGYWEKRECEGDWVKYKYDAQGNLIKVENSRGSWLKKFEYDVRGNKIKEENSDGFWKYYYYDLNGNLIKEKDSHGWRKYLYDEKGNMIKEENSHGWRKYLYDEKDNRINIVKTIVNIFINFYKRFKETTFFVIIALFSIITIPIAILNSAPTIFSIITLTTLIITTYNLFHIIKCKKGKGLRIWITGYLSIVLVLIGIRYLTTNPHIIEYNNNFSKTITNIQPNILPKKRISCYQSTIETIVTDSIQYSGITTNKIYLFPKNYYNPSHLISSINITDSSIIQHTIIDTIADTLQINGLYCNDTLKTVTKKPYKDRNLNLIKINNKFIDENFNFKDSITFVNKSNEITYQEAIRLFDGTYASWHGNYKQTKYSIKLIDEKKKHVFDNDYEASEFLIKACKNKATSRISGNLNYTEFEACKNSNSIKSYKQDTTSHCGDAKINILYNRGLVSSVPYSCRYSSNPHWVMGVI